MKKTAADNVQEAAEKLQEGLKEGLKGFPGFKGLKGLKKPSWMQ